jgi:chromosome segregation and condensation protein ScpB
MPDTADLSDKAVAVLAFAAYHQLTSGQPVKSVIREDGKGHKADEEAVAELQRRGLATLEGNDITFTADGLTVLGSAVDGLRRAAKDG